MKTATGVVSMQEVVGCCRTCVKNWTPALPYMCRSPAKEPRQPVKEKKGSGTGMGTLMPTWTARTTSQHWLFMYSMPG